MNYYIKYNWNKRGWCPWEMWLGNELIDAFVTRYTANETCDAYNEMLHLKILLDRELNRQSQ